MSHAFTVLHGHDTFDNAVEIDDYPYGGSRTKIRYWMERATKGAKKGQFRFMSCTLHPRKQVWNKPKGGNYHGFAVLLRDEREGKTQGYITFGSIPEYPWVEYHARFVASGYYVQLTDDQKAIYDGVVQIGHELNAKSATEFFHIVANEMRSRLGNDPTTDFDADAFKARCYPDTYRKTFDMMLAFLLAQYHNIYTVFDDDGNPRERYKPL